MEAIKRVQQSWELEKKAELVRLGQSNKPYPEIVVYLENEIANASRMTNFDYRIPCFKNDGIYQLSRAIEEIVGSSNVQKNDGPSGERPMNTIDVELKGGIRKKVPYGNIELPEEMGEGAIIQIQYVDDERKLYVRGKCKFRYQTMIDSIMDRTKELLKTDSIYKDLTIEIHKDVDNGQPTICRTSVSGEAMILSEKTEYAIRPLKARLLHPEKCKSSGIPLKFGAILEGPYGTGKTLLAFKLAEEANASGWACIYLKSPELLAQTLRMAKTLDQNGNGILVFVEDIDQVTSGNRDAALQDILNTLDGGDTKDMNVIALFTTNHLETIDPTFLRGKRIGTIISMPYLDVNTAEQYVTRFCEGVTLEGDFTPVYEKIAESKIAPAFMAEIVEKVKSNLVFSDEHVIKATDLDECVDSYLRQVELARTKDTYSSPELRLGESLAEVLHNEGFFDKVQDRVYNALND